MNTEILLFINSIAIIFITIINYSTIKLKNKKIEILKKYNQKLYDDNTFFIENYLKLLIAYSIQTHIQDYELAAKCTDILNKLKK